MKRFEPQAEALANAFLAGEWTHSALVARGAAALGDQPQWLPTLATTILVSFEEPPHDDWRRLRDKVLAAPEFVRACTDPHFPRRIAHWLPCSSRMRTSRWAVPELHTTADLEAWLGVSSGELDWFADAHGMTLRPGCERLNHYRYRWQTKSSGGHRLLESPKPRLKSLQRRILHGLLSALPPHHAAHGFVRGRSALSFAREHLGRAVVLRIDLEDFFTSIRQSRVYAIFRTAGYSDAVARVLAALCSNALPAREMAQSKEPATTQERLRLFRLGQRLRCPHLPQGAPTSPALANLAAFRLDQRLQAAASAAGAHYARYADDLAFSGDQAFARRVSRFQILAAGIAIDEGFAVNFRKTRIMRQSTRQQLAGVVTNARPNLPRRERDTLEAILFNSKRFGPSSQNREGLADFRSHLRGRIAWVRHVSPSKAERLEQLFADIQW